jgi:pyrimidine operon attenuation protein/uracil phosphoribosyltransferase
MGSDRVKILASKKVQQMIERMVHEIVENFYGEKELIIVGVKSMGSKLASRICKRLEELNHFNIVYHDLIIEKDNPLKATITLQPEANSFKGKRVLLIDDVLNSGRTMIYAAQHILQEPVKSLTTLCLVNRIHRRFPIKADIVGVSLSTTLKEQILVDLYKGREAIFLE